MPFWSCEDWVWFIWGWEESNWKLGRMGSTAQNIKNSLIRLFMNRTYGSSSIYRVIKNIGLCSLIIQVIVWWDWWISVIAINPREVFLRWVLIMEDVWRRYISLVHFPNHLRLATVTSCWSMVLTRQIYIICRWL